MSMLQNVVNERYHVPWAHECAVKDVIEPIFFVLTEPFKN